MSNQVKFGARERLTARVVGIYQGDGSFVPNGTIHINANGEYDVYQYERAEVNVPQGGGTEYEEYNGPYTVTPTTKGVILDTDNKVMKQDVTVQAIPTATLATPSISIVDRTITATVNQTEEGYVSKSTKKETAQIPDKFVIPSGGKTIKENGFGIPVAGLAYVDVEVPTGGGGGNVTTTTLNVTPTLEEQVFNPGGDVAYSRVTVYGIPVVREANGLGESVKIG